MPDLLTNLRAHLVAEGIARVPREPGPAGARPLWLEPRLGVPAPGEGQNAVEVDEHQVLGAYVTGGFAPKPHEAWLRSDIVDVWLRADAAELNFAVERRLRAVLADRRNWLMGELQVIECLQWRPLARLESTPQAFTHTVGFLFHLYA